MTKNRNPSSPSYRLRVFIRVILFIACATAVVAAIVHARDVEQAGSTFSEQDIRQRDRISADVPTPTPPQCSCFLGVTRDDNFDYVTPPALPPDWLATNAQGPPPLWVTSDSGLPTPPADTLPNAFFIDDPPVVSDKRLDGWSISLYEDCCDQLTFRHNFNLEASDSDPNVGFDGGVLEMSTDGGNTFQDILAVGWFVTGGYNRTIATDRGSPIAGRQAWSGNSGGFVTTVVGLPSNVIQGKLRWRMASDNSGGSDGWRVDTFHMTWCQGGGTPCPTPTHRPSVTPRPRLTPAPRP
jgi:hypothetical protein